MFSMYHLIILVIVYFAMVAIVEIIPELIASYRERYHASSSRTSREWSKFFLNIKPGRILIGSVIFGALLGISTGSWVLAGALSLSGIFAPRIFLTIWKDIRSDQFEGQLMDALILLSNSMKSGLDIAAGIERVTVSTKPPISEEFGLVLNAYRLGAPLEEALIDLTHRIRSRTLETVVYAIGIQRETGGNLIKTFDQLVATIREESKLQKKIRAITSQGRTQIIFLAGFPWLLALIFYLMSPDFMAPALAHPLGQVVMIGLVLWEIIGILITKRIVTVDI